MAKKAALGRGLSALLSAEEDVQTKTVQDNPGVLGAIAELPVAEITANPFQPRTYFEDQALTELKDSIAVHGLIQPVTVRKTGPHAFQLISGERRFRASQLAGLSNIPAYIRVADDQAMLEMALVENIQRQELDSIEIAISYQRLIDECNITQEEVGKKVSKNRSTVTNYLRLLKLSPSIQSALRQGQLSMGHARALLSLSDEKVQQKAFKKIVEEALSVRQAEQLIRELKNPEDKKKSSGPSHKFELTFEQQKHREELERIVDSKLEIKRDSTGKGKITIGFQNDDDLTRILEILNP